MSVSERKNRHSKYLSAQWFSLSMAVLMTGEADKTKSTDLPSPPEPCLNFSFFFFLHFQGLKMRPRLASLLLRRMGGVRTPVTIQPEWSVLGCSMTSTTESMGERESEAISRLHYNPAALPQWEKHRITWVARAVLKKKRSALIKYQDDRVRKAPRWGRHIWVLSPKRDLL